MWDFKNPKEFTNKGLNIGSICITWCGKKDKEHKRINFNPKYWFQKEKNHHWKILCCKCYTCGATWDTPPFPTDIMTEKELDNIFSEY